MRVKIWPKAVVYSVILIILLAVTILGWQVLLKERSSNIHAQVKHTLQAFNLTVKNKLGADILPFQRMATHWRFHGGSLQQAWEAEAKHLLNASAVYQRLEWIDPACRVRWVSPVGALERGHVVSKACKSALNTAKQASRSVMDKLMTLPQGREGFMVLVPIKSHHQFGGFLAIVFRATDFFKPLFNSALFQQMNVEVFVKHRLIFSHEPYSNLAENYVTEDKLNVAGLFFTVKITPSLQYLSSLTTLFPTFFLVIGLFLCCLMGLIFSLFLLANRRSESTQERAESLSPIYQSTQAIIMESAVDTILMIDTQGIIHDCNAAVFELLGYSPENLMGTSVNRLMSKENARNHDQDIRRYLNTGMPHILGIGREVEARHKDGRAIVLWLSVNEIKLQGQVFFIGMLRDISKQKRYEKSLKASQEQIALLLNSAGEGIYGLDLEGKTTFINSAALTMLGYSEDEVLGKPMHDLVHHSYPDGRSYPKNQCPMHAALSDGELHHIDNEVLWRKDGCALSVEYTSTPMSRDGKLQGAVIVFNDITEAKKQRELINFNHALMDKLVTIQNDYLSGSKSQDLFSQVLNILLDLTHSQCGFIGKVINVKSGNPYLQFISMNHVEWSKSIKLDCGEKLKQGLECHAFDTLIGETLQTSRQVVAVLPNQALVEVALPWGDLTILSYIGLPIFGKEGFIGMIGLLNTTLESSYNTEIIACINPILNALSSIMDAEEAAKKLEQMAHHDELTGLYNRAFFNEYLEKTLALAKRQGSFFALIYLDIDDFKEINDGLGHPVGDALLQEVAQRLLSVSRASDVVARLGGDEFILIVTNTHSVREVGRFADKIIGLASQPYNIGVEKLYVTTSAGVACFPSAGNDAEVLFKNVDIALYKAKAAGKNQYKIFSEIAVQEDSRKVKMQQSLPGAMKREEFFLVYQPQWHLRDKKMVGMEALLRWESSMLGTVLPEEFIDLLEADKSIHEVGLWVIETAFQLYSKAKLQLPSTFKLAINLSGTQFQDPQLAKTIGKLMQLYHVDAKNLEFEVTEGSVINTAYAVPILAELRRMGAKIAIDDFGTGYSSLSRLKDLPIDILKIDKSFVLSVPKVKESELIIENTLQLASKLRLDVVAEGIETEEQLQFLIKHGCEFGQGFHLGKPMSLESVIKLSGR